MIKSPEALRQYVRLHHDVVSHAEACRRMQMDQSTVFVWIRLSKAAAERKENPSEWLIEIDGEERYFHEHCSRSFADCFQNIVGNAFVRARDGYTTTAKFQGQTIYKLNPDWIDEGMRDLLGLGPGDMYLRDKQGNMIPETITVAPSTDLVLALMSAHAPKIYGRKSTVDVNSRISGGVQIMGGPRPAQVAAPVQLPILEVIEDAEPEPALAVTDTPPDQPAEAIDDDDDGDEPAPADPGPRISVATPPQYRPPRNPLIDPSRADALRQDFLRKLPADNSAVRAALLKGK